jgi:enamine deaminase RidA (YjgF/YER057c/UK114 family)
VTIPALAHANPTPADHIRPLEPAPPAWVADLFRDTAGGTAAVYDIDGLEVLRRPPFVRVTARVPDAARLCSDGLAAAVAARYTSIARLLEEDGRHPIRFWNYVPGILDWMSPGLDRYMAFNRGRHAAYSQGWHRAAFERSIPSASAIGIVGPDLVIDCLGSELGGTAVDNPRQRASWRYSRRYGPKPPCFARGTITSFDGTRILLVAGTASIVGEESRHAGDVRAQIDEVIRNLEALIVHAGGCPARPLHQLTDARIYVVHPADACAIAAAFRAHTSPDLRTEWAVARVCRKELLVEIEGVARLEPR